MTGDLIAARMGNVSGGGREGWVGVGGHVEVMYGLHKWDWMDGIGGWVGDCQSISPKGHRGYYMPLYILYFCRFVLFKRVEAWLMAEGRQCQTILGET